MRKIVGIERLRAVAIAMVYLIHAHVFGYFQPLQQLGTWAGVDLFFVISGFVVTLSLERLIPERMPRSLRSSVSPEDGRALRVFYLRRFFRLAPIAGCSLLLHLLGATFGPMVSAATPFGVVRDWAFEALAIVSGLYNFISPYMPKRAMIFFWSLSVEEQFYLLLPTLFLLAPTKRGRTLAALGVLLSVACVFRPFFSPNLFEVAHFWSPFRFDALAAGVVLALQREHLGAFAARVGRSARRVLVFVCLGVLVFVSRHMDIQFAIHDGLVPIWLASACLVACAAIDSRDVLDIPGVNRALEYVGSRSYAIYVLHEAFLFLDETLVDGANARWKPLLSSVAGQTVRFALTAAVVLLVAELAHRYVELPAIRAGKRYVESLRVPAVATRAAA